MVKPRACFEEVNDDIEPSYSEIYRRLVRMNRLGVRARRHNSKFKTQNESSTQQQQQKNPIQTTPTLPKTTDILSETRNVEQENTKQGATTEESWYSTTFQTIYGVINGVLEQLSVARFVWLLLTMMFVQTILCNRILNKMEPMCRGMFGTSITMIQYGLYFYFGQTAVKAIWIVLKTMWKFWWFLWRVLGISK